MRFFLSFVMMPPNGLLFFLPLLAILSFWYRWCLWLLLLCSAALYLLATPMLAAQLHAWTYHGLEVDDLSAGARPQCEALVVLGAGHHWMQSYPEGSLYLYPDVIHRLRKAIQLHRRYHLPILVSGGATLHPEAPSEADAMADFLRNEFFVPVYWREGRSSNTEQNAQFSAELLRAHQISRVCLVTSLSHMRRALFLFEQTGLEVSPFPADYFPDQAGYVVQDFLPSLRSLRFSHIAIHELVGQAYYASRAFFGAK